MTEQEQVEWEQRLRASVEETLRRRTARAQQRQDHAERRRYGLAQRHARKLNHNREARP
jgi:hypothetical protein